MTKNVVIDGVEYQPVEPENERMQIICCHRGFVFVGMVSDRENEVVIRDASCIRKWGTTKGLGEIASGGPTAKTILDHSGTVRVHPLSIVARIDCEADKWK